MSTSDPGTRWWLINLIAGGALVALSALSLTQPILGFAVTLAWFSYVLVAVTASVVIAAVSRRRAANVPLQAATWVAVYAIAGLLYALLSFALGYLVDQRSGFQIYGVVWVFNLVPLLVYLGASVGVARVPRRNHTAA